MPARHLTEQDILELVDLYKWGARMGDLEVLYDAHRCTIKLHIKRMGVPMRSPHRAPLVSFKPHSGSGRIKSSRPLIPVGAVMDDALPTPDQLLSSSARGQQDMRTAARR